MKYSKEQFIKDVKKEVRALKKHATKKELKKLSLIGLNPDNKYNCIYGQMTGECTSERASKLIYNCCPRYFKTSKALKRKDSEHSFWGVLDVSISSIKEGVNGKKLGNDFNEHRLARIEFSHVSAIEAYIALPNAKNKNLIDFLQGKRKDLVL